MADAAWETAIRGVALAPVDFVQITVECPLGGTVSTVYAKNTSEASIVARRLGIDVLPYLINVPGTSVKINPDGVKADRSTKNFQFIDEENPEPFDSACTSIGTVQADMTSYWRTWRFAFPDWLGALVEVFSFAEDTALTLFSQAEPVWCGRIRNMKFGTDLSVTLEVQDAFDIKKVQIPPAISDSNTLVSTIGSGDSNLDVQDGTEFTSLDAITDGVDYPPTCLKVDSELILVRNVNVNQLNFITNFLLRSEEFANVAWTKLSATATDVSIHGPWAGEAINGSLIEFSAATAHVTQAGSHAASGNEHVTLWVREHPDFPGDSVKLQVRDGSGAETAEVTITLTDEWVRYFIAFNFTGAATGNVELRFLNNAGAASKCFISQAQQDAGSQARPYGRSVATSGNAIGRGAFGTTAAGHTAGVKVKENQVFRSQDDELKGLGPGTWIRTCLNRMFIADVDVNTLAIQAESDISAGDAFRRTYTNPTDAQQILSDIREQALWDVWPAENGLVTSRLKFRPKLAGQTFFAMTEGENILVNGIDLDEFKKSRVTASTVFFSLLIDSDGIEHEGTKPDHFAFQLVAPNFPAEGPNKRNAEREVLFADLIYRTVEASAYAARRDARFSLGADKIRLQASYQVRPDVKVGDVVTISSPLVVAEAAGAVAEAVISFQVIGINDEGGGENLAMDLMEALGTRGMIIAPDTVSSEYDTATPADREFGYIANDGPPATVGTAKDPPYLIN